MAKERILKVQDSLTGEEILVQATNGKKAVSFVVKDRFSATLATAEDVTRLVNAGQKVHKVEPEVEPPKPAEPANLHIEPVKSAPELTLG